MDLPVTEAEDAIPPQGISSASSSASVPVDPIRVVTAEELGPTWNPSCPIGLEELRAVRVAYFGTDGQEHAGELIVHHEVAQEVAAIFADIFEARFPIHEIASAATRGGDDDALMADDITSGFNCRFVDGTNRWSKHAYGRAIDINPFENPWVRAGGKIDPPEAEVYVDRSNSDPRLIRPDGPVVTAFRSQGWSWGGDWVDPDYQHFAHEKS